MKRYGVQSRDGQWFRAKGYGGRGDSWTDKAQAKLYDTEGKARSRATWWASHYPDFGVPHVVEFDLIEVRKIAVPKPPPKPTPEERRVAAAKARVAAAERELNWAKEALK